VYTDCDTPSGDASLLQLHNPGQGDSDNILSSTVISTMDCTARPDPNLSNIPPQISLSVHDCTTGPQANLSGAPAGTLRPQPSMSMTCLSVMSEPSSAISCDLCGQIVKGRAYLSQHKNKKKCLERQRVQKETQQSLDASAARSLSLRVSESDIETSAGISKVTSKTVAEFSPYFILDLGTLSLWYNVWKQGSIGEPYECQA
jgi:hypothetical protein